MLVVGDELGLDAVALEQQPRAPGVLARDDVRVAQRREHAQRDVLEVPDRRRADDQAPAHRRRPRADDRAVVRGSARRRRRRRQRRTARVISRRLARHQRSADHPRLLAECRRDHAHRVARRRQRAREHLAAGRLEQHLAGRDHAAADHDHLRVEQVDQAGEADSKGAADGLERVARDRVTVMRQLCHERARQLASLLERVTERGVRPARHPQRRLAHERGAGRHHLQAAAVGAAALARRAVHVDHHVAELSARPDPAALQPAAEHEPTADAGAEREHHHVARAAAGAVPRLRQHRAVAVVVDHHREAQAFGHDRRERDVRQRQVRGVDGHPRAPVERHGDAEADGDDLFLDLSSSLLHRLDDRGQQPRLVEPERLAPDAVTHSEIGPDDARQELRAAEVDPDHAARA